MELPIWLASSLCSRRRHVVSVELPKSYREPHREILSADATVVDLHKLGPHFYACGTRLIQFDHPESLDIAKTLLQVCWVIFFRVNSFFLLMELSLLSKADCFTIKNHSTQFYNK